MRADPDGAAASVRDLAALDVLHLDMDCFFASVEALDDPRLAGRPLVVGGLGERGVVCSASYEARAFGVRSAMPTGEARRLCPQAAYLPPRHDRYAELSHSIHAILTDVTPVTEGLGLDEAYLDVSGSHRLFGPSEQIGVALRRRIRLELGLPCSVGVARNKLVAKLASKAAKPDASSAALPPGARRVATGVVAVDRGAELAFLHAHAVRALPGVGPRTEQRLARFGVSSVADLSAVPRESLERLLGAAAGSSLFELARGLDGRAVAAERGTRSIGHEETFPRDVRDAAELTRRAREMAAAVAERCRRAGLEARTVSVKIRYADFSTHTRSRTLTSATARSSVFGDAVTELLAGTEQRGGVRLLGVHVSSLGDAGSAPEQLSLFGARQGAPAGRPDLEQVADPVRDRFGAASIVPASALYRPSALRDDVGPGGAERTGA